MLGGGLAQVTCGSVRPGRAAHAWARPLAGARRLVTGAGLAGALLAGVAAPAAAQQAPPALVAGVGDSAYLPTQLSVPAGTLVIWSNQGTSSHTVTSDATSAGQPLFDSGVLRPGDSFSVIFSQPGTFTFHSNTDARYDQAGQPIYPLAGRVVVNPVAAIPVAAAAPPPPPPMQATVTVGDGGFSPATITVALGATVSWVNQGTAVHTATSAPDFFDSGGLAPGQSYSFTFTRPGAYTYVSRTDVNLANQAYTMHGTIVVVGPGS